eukprot:9747852-Karenia_brevis.AAC.1
MRKWTAYAESKCSLEGFRSFVTEVAKDLKQDQHITIPELAGSGDPKQDRSAIVNAVIDICFHDDPAGGRELRKRSDAAAWRAFARRECEQHGETDFRAF